MNVSVIIPTRNRAPLLENCLERLVPLLGRDDEVIVVDNGSNDDTKVVVLNYYEKFSVRYLTEPNRGPSFARNLGISHANSEILAFLDDDCLVSPHWLSEIKRTCKKEAGKNENNVYQGKIKHRFLKTNFLSQVFYLRNRKNWNQIKKGISWRKYGYINFLQAGNFFLRKTILDSLDYVFDAETFPFIGEERDLAIKLQLAGHNIVYIPEVRVTHIKKTPNIFRSFVVTFFYGRAEGILESRYAVQPKIKKLFEKELGFSEKRSVGIKKLLSLGKQFRTLGLIFYLGVVAYLFTREGVFLLGKLYGKFLATSS